MNTFIGEREVESFEPYQGGNRVKIKFTNGQSADLSGTVFYEIQTEKALSGVTTTQLVASYFATELLKDLALNGIELGMLPSIMNAIENITENKKEKAFSHPFGKKNFLQVGFDQMFAEADAAEQEEAAEREALAKETPAPAEAVDNDNKIDGSQE